MSEVTDLIMPILQRIQADLEEVKRVQAEHGQKLEDLEIYMAYGTGLAAQSKADVQAIRSEVRTIKQRLERLEAGP